MTQVNLNTEVPAFKLSSESIIICARPNQEMIEKAEKKGDVILTVHNRPDYVLAMIENNELTISQTNWLYKGWLLGFMFGLEIEESSNMLVYLIDKHLDPNEWAEHRREVLLNNFKTGLDAPQFINRSVKGIF